MLNPVVAGSTFCCDGCGHHASFHVLKGEYPNPSPDGHTPEVVGMGMGEMLQRHSSSSQQSQQSHSQQPQASNGKGSRKRVIELDFDNDFEETLGDGIRANDGVARDTLDGSVGGMVGEWVDGDEASLMIVKRSTVTNGNGNGNGARGARRRNAMAPSPSAQWAGSSGGREKGHLNENGSPAAKRSRV